jgi:hypothetical protein
MKFLIEVLDGWPEEAVAQGGFVHRESVEPKLVAVLGEDRASVTASVLRAPGLEAIPAHALLKITRAD